MSKAINGQADGSRRRALKKLGLGLAAAYSAPALLMLSGCHAHGHHHSRRHGYSHHSYPSYSRPSYSRPSRPSRPSRW